MPMAAHWLAELSVDLHETVHDAIRDATDATEAWWRAASEGSENEPEHDPNEADDPGDHRGPGAGLVAPIGAEDNAAPTYRHR